MFGLSLNAVLQQRNNRRMEKCVNSTREIETVVLRCSAGVRGREVHYQITLIGLCETLASQITWNRFLRVTRCSELFGMRGQLEFRPPLSRNNLQIEFGNVTDVYIYIGNHNNNVVRRSSSPSFFFFFPKLQGARDLIHCIYSGSFDIPDRIVDFAIFVRRCASVRLHNERRRRNGIRYQSERLLSSNLIKRHG